MVYLSEKSIIHRDLALRNFLVTKQAEKYLIKISDFGLSRFTNSNYYKTNNSEIPIRWGAPEVFEKGKSSIKSDVWSFGIVLYEIFSYGNQPYIGMSNKEVIENVLKGYRMDIPDNCSEKIGKLMKECWNYNLEDRPNFKDILQILKEE